MFDFYFYSQERLILMFILTIFLFVLQATYVSALIFNNPIKRKKLIIGEILMLMYFAVMALTPITAMINRRYGIINFDFLDTAFYVVGALAIAYFIYMIIIKEKFYIVPIITIVISLPIMSAVPYDLYIVLFMSSIAISVIRSYPRLSKELYKQKYELSAFSVKEGLDTLPTGVMFCGEDGYIYIINAKMKELVERFFEKEQKNGREFWQRLENCDIVDAECQNIEGDVLLRTSVDAWRFSRQKFVDEHTQYVEITAIDVSETITAFGELERDRTILIEQNKEIKKLSKKIEMLRREQEYSRIRSRVHDVISQRLTAMQRILQSHDNKNYSEIVPILQDMMSQIKAKESGDAKEIFNELYEYFKRVGLYIKLFGSIPTDESVAFLFLAVLREACTNASRHAGATEVYAKVYEKENKYRIEITNNGTPPSEGITEGSGLAGIRNRIENIGGSFRVELIPEFAIIILIERSDGIDKSFNY